jgi:hypothetical protein
MIHNLDGETTIVFLFNTQCLWFYQYNSVNIYIYMPVSIYTLVGGLEHVLFFMIYGIILPIDFHIFQDG